MRKINTTRFGEIEVDESKVVHFKDGMPAFEDEHEFIVVPYDMGSPYYFLQSLDTPELTFLLAMPYLFFPEYEFEIDDDVLEEMGIKDREQMLVYAVVTIPNGRIKEMTANLLAPVIINTETRQAKQVVLEGSKYTTKHRMFPKEQGGAEK